MSDHSGEHPFAAAAGPGSEPRIEDYALIGNTRTAALVGRSGSIDWLCLPRFDSPAVFASLLGRTQNGRWMIAPADHEASVQRRYLEDTLVLETEFHTGSGVVSVIDFMPVPTVEGQIDLVRLVKGVRGSVPMRMSCIFRFDYGRIAPWVRRREDGLFAIAGPDALLLATDVPLHGEDFRTVARFHVSAGQTVPFVLTWYRSHRPDPAAKDATKLYEETVEGWRKWSRQSRFEGGSWRDPVMRSLITLKALTYSPTGGMVAAATTSLPELPGGVRNWDYRYCWIRDATFTLYALVILGFTEEAAQWREWLLRSAAGKPEELQIMYGLAGERRLTEYEVPWLRGFLKSRPVRVGNAAHGQFQLDVYGELMDAFHTARKSGIAESGDSWRVEQVLLEFLESAWDKPDQGLWEVRGAQRQFTHSKVMAWVAFARAVTAVERFGLAGPVDRWRQLRDAIHADICRNAVDIERQCFVQAYGSRDLDASLLLIPLVGFLPASDPRVRGTVAAIERELMSDGLVRRYSNDGEVDGLPSGEGVFLACSFWLADNLVLQGRYDDAQAMFERLLDLRNDVGLLAEEYDTVGRRQLGNFPQAFSHVGLINTAHNLVTSRGPAHRRRE